MKGSVPSRLLLVRAATGCSTDDRSVPRKRQRERERERARLGPRDAAPGLPTLANAYRDPNAGRGSKPKSLAEGAEGARGTRRRLRLRDRSTLVDSGAGEGCPKSAVSGEWQPAFPAWPGVLADWAFDRRPSTPSSMSLSLSASWLNQAPGKRSTTQRPPPTSQRAAPDAPADLLAAFYCTAAVRQSQQAPCVPVMCQGRRSLAATLAAAL
ncbi:Nn.00g095350.m01.CDS01 [Neocucurbitaria sp. VM-36]